jgi:hypothetical protein
MATATKTQFPPFAGDPAQLLETAVQAGTAATEAYLDGLDQLAGLQRRLLKDTPLAPLAGLTSLQAEVTRQFAEGFLSTGDRLTEQAKETAVVAQQGAAKAEQSAAKVVKRQAKATRKTVKKATELVTGPAEAPIAGYDALTAEEIIGRLPQVSQKTLTQLAAYETAHDARATVLERIRSLQGRQPAPGYDQLNVADVQKLLTGADTALATRVRDYERGHKRRDSVLQAAERQLTAS